MLPLNNQSAFEKKKKKTLTLCFTFQYIFSFPALSNETLTRDCLLTIIFNELIFQLHIQSKTKF